MMMSVLIFLEACFEFFGSRTATIRSSSTCEHLIAKDFIAVFSPLKTRLKTSITSNVHQICAPVFTTMPASFLSHSMRSILQ